MSFFIFMIVIYGIYVMFIKEDDSNSTNNSEQGEIIYPYGDYVGGYYNEEIHVFTRGPVSCYELGEEEAYFYVFCSGKLSLKNSSGSIDIELEELGDRILPTSIIVNNEPIPSVDNKGEFVLSNQKQRNISLARTINYIIDEQEKRGFNEQLITSTGEFLLQLLRFNMLVKRNIITSYTAHRIYVNKKYKYKLIQRINELWDEAIELTNKYSSTYFNDSQSQKIEYLLSILELDPSERDLGVIKRQYKILARKYHPDVYSLSDKKFIEVKEAYDELCSYLQAS